MKSDHLLIIGCGDIGTRVGLAWHAAGGRVTAVRRHPEQLPTVFERIAADYTASETLVPLGEISADAILFSPLPAGRDVSGYERGFSGGVAALESTGIFKRVSRGVMISSTRVYAEGDGGIVDENSPLTQVDPSAMAIIDAEQRFMAALPTTGSVLRASGLYGLEPGSNNPGMLLGRILAGQASGDPGRISNRVHRYDLAAAVLHLLGRPDEHGDPGGLYPGIFNCSDSAPTPIGEVEAYVAKRAGVQLQRGDGVALTSGRGNRRVSNKRLLATGFNFQYADFRQGYSAILAELGLLR